MGEYSAALDLHLQMQSICLLLTVQVALLITVNNGFCIIEILGFMYALGIVIDSVSIINIVLAVGLSVDYSAHVGHCFMLRGGNSKDDRATEALAVSIRSSAHHHFIHVFGYSLHSLHWSHPIQDIGASVLNGAISTFLAAAVLLFSKSSLAIQFALTVSLGVIHGLVLLPVLLSLFGPQPFASADAPRVTEDNMAKKAPGTEHAESFGVPPESVVVMVA